MIHPSFRPLAQPSTSPPVFALNVKWVHDYLTQEFMRLGILNIIASPSLTIGHILAMKLSMGGSNYCDEAATMIEETIYASLSADGVLSTLYPNATPEHWDSVVMQVHRIVEVAELHLEVYLDPVISKYRTGLEEKITMYYFNRYINGMAVFTTADANFPLPVHRSYPTIS